MRMRVIGSLLVPTPWFTSLRFRTPPPAGSSSCRPTCWAPTTSPRPPPLAASAGWCWPAACTRSPPYPAKRSFGRVIHPVRATCMERRRHGPRRWVRGWRRQLRPRWWRCESGTSPRTAPTQTQYLRGSWPLGSAPATPQSWCAPLWRTVASRSSLPTASRLTVIAVPTYATRSSNWATNPSTMPGRLEERTSNGRLGVSSSQIRRAWQFGSETCTPSRSPPGDKGEESVERQYVQRQYVQHCLPEPCAGSHQLWAGILDPILTGTREGWGLRSA